MIMNMIEMFSISGSYADAEKSACRIVYLGPSKLDACSTALSKTDDDA